MGQAFEPEYLWLPIALGGVLAQTENQGLRRSWSFLKVTWQLSWKVQGEGTSLRRLKKIPAQDPFPPFLSRSPVAPEPQGQPVKSGADLRPRSLCLSCCVMLGVSSLSLPQQAENLACGAQISKPGVDEVLPLLLLSPSPPSHDPQRSAEFTGWSVSLGVALLPP